MTKKNVRIASSVMPVILAMLLLSVGSSRVRASDQPSTANVAIKIDNFVFGPQGDYGTCRNNSDLDEQ